MRGTAKGIQFVFGYATMDLTFVCQKRLKIAEATLDCANGAHQETVYLYRTPTAQASSEMCRFGLRLGLSVSATAIEGTATGADTAADLEGLGGSVSVDANLFAGGGAHYGTGSSGGHAGVGARAGVGGTVNLTSTDVESADWQLEHSVISRTATEMHHRTGPKGGCELSDWDFYETKEETEWVENPRLGGHWEALVPRVD